MTVHLSLKGGYIRINKIFNEKLDMVLHTINEYLYSA